MLLAFKTRNYKSFVEEATFSMRPAPKQKGLDYSILSQTIDKKEVKALCSSVLYGPNASGKTNLIGAMDTFRAIVLRGNIRNSSETPSPNVVAYNLELIPNTEQDEKPVLFEISYVENALKVQYMLEIALGNFLNHEYKRKVIREDLFINDAMVFQRSDELVFGDLTHISELSSELSEEQLPKLAEIAKSSLGDEDLFLTNGFKLIISPQLGIKILNWFTNRLMVIYRADSMQLIRQFVDPQKKAIYIEKTINNAAKQFGISSNDLGYITKDGESEAQLCSVFKKTTDKTSTVIPAELFESFGTMRFVNLFPLVLRAMKTGATLVIDEFDASIHPMALMSIINIFHNDDLNVHNAQLIFNTHNPIFLNANLFRRDEIKFAERDEQTHAGSLYALSDFGTTGENGVRKHEDYMKKYFINQYGGIKDVDFSPVFEKLLDDENEV